MKILRSEITYKNLNPLKHWTNPLTPTSTKLKNLGKNFLILPVAKEYLVLSGCKNTFQVLIGALKAPWSDTESRSNLWNDNLSHTKQGLMSLFGGFLLYLVDSIDTGYNFDSSLNIDTIIKKATSLYLGESNDIGSNIESDFFSGILDIVPSYFRDSTTIALNNDKFHSYSLFFLGAATCALGAYLLYNPSSSIFHWSSGPPQFPLRDNTEGSSQTSSQQTTQQVQEQQNEKLQQQRLQPKQRNPQSKAPTMEEFNRDLLNVLRQIREKKLQQGGPSSISLQGNPQARRRGPLPTPPARNVQQEQGKSKEALPSEIFSGKNTTNKMVAPAVVAEEKMLEELEKMEEEGNLAQEPNLLGKDLNRYQELMEKVFKFRSSNQKLDKSDPEYKHLIVQVKEWNYEDERLIDEGERLVQKRQKKKTRGPLTGLFQDGN